MQHLQCQKLANSNLMQVYFVRLDLDQITDIPEMVPVHLWLDHTVTTDNVTFTLGHHLPPLKSKQMLLARLF